MEKINSTEAMLAELIERAEEHNKKIMKMDKSMGQITERLNWIVAFENSQDTHQEVKSVITLKDHEEKVAHVKNDVQKILKAYSSLKEKYEELQKVQRYWATNQWAKHLFRWLFLKRHLWIWIVYAVFNAMLLGLMYVTSIQSAEIEKFQESDIKYRYLIAVGAAPKTIRLLNRIFIDEDADGIRKVKITVEHYETSLIHKSDSIVRAEQQAIERLK